MIGQGLVNWWGFSPPVDLLSYNNGCELETGMVQVAVVGAGDPRHLLLTLARGGARGKHLRMYVIEAQVEVYARLLLLVGTALQLGLGLRERVGLLLDMWANLYLRPASRTYLELTARRLAMSVTDPGQNCKLVGLVSAARLKYRERDALDAVFRSWYTLTSAKYDPALAWDTRQRQLLGTRYDYRQAEADWAWHMRLTFRIQKLHEDIHKPGVSEGDKPWTQQDGYVGVSDAWGRDFLTWRGSGRAFTVATDSTATLANTSLASVAVVTVGTTRHRRLGYWGDLLSGPFPALALASHLSLVNKTQNGRATVSGSELALRQLEYILHQLLSEYMEGEEVQGGQSKHVQDETKTSARDNDDGNSSEDQDVGDGRNIEMKSGRELRGKMTEEGKSKEDEEDGRSKEKDGKYQEEEENGKEKERQSQVDGEKSKEEDKEEKVKRQIDEEESQEEETQSTEEQGRNDDEENEEEEVERSEGEEEGRGTDDGKNQREEKIEEEEERRPNEGSVRQLREEVMSQARDEFHQERHETNSLPVQTGDADAETKSEHKDKDYVGKGPSPSTPQKENVKYETERTNITGESFKWKVSANVEDSLDAEVAVNSNINLHEVQNQTIKKSKGHEIINSGSGKKNGNSEDEEQKSGFHRSHSLDQTPVVKESGPRSPARRCRSTSECPTAATPRKKSSAEGGRPYLDYLQLEGVEVVLLSPSRLGDLSSLPEVEGGLDVVYLSAATAHLLTPSLLTSHLRPHSTLILETVQMFPELTDDQVKAYEAQVTATAGRSGWVRSGPDPLCHLTFRR